MKDDILSLLCEILNLVAELLSCVLSIVVPLLGSIISLVLKLVDKVLIDVIYELNVTSLLKVLCL